MNDPRKRLEEEIKKLDRELRIELPKEILTAREHGDLRENAEFKSAKERQRFVEARLSQLHGQLAALSRVNMDKIPRDKVGLGSTVYLKDVNNGEDVVYELVSSEEVDPSKGRISPSSPIGKSLLGHEEGDEVQVKVPAGSREFEITRLVTIHDQTPEADA